MLNLAQYSTKDSLIQDKAVWTSLPIKDRLKALAEIEKRNKLAPIPAAIQANPIPQAMIVNLDPATPLNQDSIKKTFSLSIQLNEMQLAAVEMAKTGKSFCLTGKAGTGKTTVLREIMRALLEQFEPSQIGAGAYTRVATGNIRKAIERDEELSQRIIGQIRTIHKHLEFMPVFFEVLDKDGSYKKTMRFEPMRTAQNPLDYKLFISEESSMWGLDLWQYYYNAMRAGCIMIFVGDINQLPPVFGKSIFNYALSQLPVIELTEIHRQALDSGIIQNAIRVLNGEIPVSNKDCDIIAGNPKKKTGQVALSAALGQAFSDPKKTGFFHKLYLSGEYDPKQDIILSPWNKQDLGTIRMNDWIAQFLGDERSARVFEIIAGRRKLYLAEGDQVFIDKQQGIIKEIVHNGGYMGKPPRPANVNLLRWGSMRIVNAKEGDEEDFELSMSGYENINADEIPDEDKKNQASHIVKVQLEDSDTLIELQTAGDFGDAKFSLGYCITVHKAQGCEWRKVYFIMHEDHCATGGFISRELIYTGMTRAREKLCIIAKENVLQRGVKNQIIKGKTLEEKIAFINSGAGNIGDYPVTKPLYEKQTFRKEKEMQ